MTLAEQLVRSLLEAVENGFAVDVPALYAADAQVTQPFAFNGPETLHGGGQITEHFHAAASTGVRVKVKNLRMHQTVDPHVVIVEFDYEWNLPEGATFETANIQVIEERDGLISTSRDYHDTTAIRGAFEPHP